MLRKIHRTNFFRIKFLGGTNIKCRNRPMLPPAQVFYLMVSLYIYYWNPASKGQKCFSVSIQDGKTS
jgi:type II secretory pathway component PulM